MLAAKDAGFIADAFRVEDSYPCEVAERAGLLLTNARARARCDSARVAREQLEKGNSDRKGGGVEAMAKTAKGKNVRNKNGRVRFEPRDVVSVELRALIADVASRGGYPSIEDDTEEA